MHAYPGGDHTIFVGRVEAAECRTESEPLLYFRGRYGRVAQPAAQPAKPAQPGGSR